MDGEVKIEYLGGKCDRRSLCFLLMGLCNK